MLMKQRLNPLIIREELQRGLCEDCLDKQSLNPLIIREELQQTVKVVKLK